jgi:uncharacterized damage-inducible protein DinB
MAEELIKTQIVSLWKDYIYPNILEALDKSPADRLDWAPAEKMIELGNLFLHIAECSDWWYSEVMLKQESAELAVAGRPCPEKDIIRKHLEDHQRRMLELFSASDEVLAGEYIIEGKSQVHKFKGAWIYVHVIEHDIHHRSQINQYLRILGIDPPEI